MEVIELSTGHVFAPGSVKVVGPVYGFQFEIIGVGFRVSISLPEWEEPEDIDTDTHEEWSAKRQRASDEYDAKCEEIRREAIDKLLGHG